MEGLLNWYRQLRPQSTLDVGSGIGEVYMHLNHYNATRHYVMCDFVNTMRRRCAYYTGITPELWDGKVLPYEGDSFDMVLSVAVFLHVPPADLDRVFAEHVRVSGHWIIVASFAGSASSINSEHCFAHNYTQMFKRHAVNIVDRRSFKKTRQGHWLLKIK